MSSHVGDVLTLQNQKDNTIKMLKYGIKVVVNVGVEFSCLNQKEIIND